MNNSLPYINFLFSSHLFKSTGIFIYLLQSCLKGVMIFWWPIVKPIPFTFLYKLQYCFIHVLHIFSYRICQWSLNSFLLVPLCLIQIDMICSMLCIFHVFYNNPVPCFLYYLCLMFSLLSLLNVFYSISVPCFL